MGCHHHLVVAGGEVSALILLPGASVPVRSVPWGVITVDGIVNNLLDLTDPATLAALGTTAQEMTGTWVASPYASMQLLARLAYDSGRITGIQHASAKHPGGLNVVVFPDRLPIVAGNYLEVYAPHGHLAQRIH